MSFVNNLKLLCDHYSSIAQVCRKIGINRSQFNKYLNGQTHPSKSNIKIICDFFGVDEFEILMPNEQFSQIIAPKLSNQAANSGTSVFFDKIIKLKYDSSPSLARYIGWYYEYYYSLGYPGQVFQSLIEVKQSDDGLIYKRYERLIAVSQKHEQVTHCLYEGVLLNLSDRIFLLDVECLTENEMTQTILFPSYRSQIKQLYGLKTGVSSKSHRLPACTRVLYDFIGKDINFKKHFKSCGLYEPAQVNPEIIQSINNNKDPDTPLFYAQDQ
ncbi:helix-turn-helix transcriptional regulator [Gammaproteobacteria bacterium AS21]